MRKIMMSGIGALAALAIAGCGGSPDAWSTEPAPAADGDLTLGSRGDEVVAVHRYLARFGYLPNDELARTYPSWRPIVADPPDDPSLFDDHSAEAVRALQAFAGLTVTGRVDTATRALMKRPRCGVPEGIAPLDPSDKFAGSGQKWNKQIVRWRLRNTPISTGLNTTEVRNAIQGALDTWQVDGIELFPEAINSSDIDVKFAKIDGPSNILAQTSLPNDGGDVTIDQSETWTTIGGPGFDLQTVLLHELGHALGLNHSGWGVATMFPFNMGTDQTLDIDDRVAFGALYNSFGKLPGRANDIGVAIGPNRAVWIISDEPWGNGFRVKHWNDSGWDDTDGGAVRIAVGPDAIPWLIDSATQIWRRTTADPFVSGAWQLMNGAGVDVGVGADGSVWVIGTDPVPGGFGIWRFNGSSWDRAVDGGAVKIAVDEFGIPWVINNQNNIFRRTTANPFVAGAWEHLPGISTDIAIGIGGAGRHAWGVGTTSAGQLSLAVWNEQPFVAAGGSPNDAPKKFLWDMGKKIGPGGSRIAVTADATGRPWLVDGNGAILTANR